MMSNKKQKKQWTLDELLLKIEEIGNGEYEYVGGFTSITKHITIKHKVCGYQYEILPYNFFKGRKCGLCQNRVVVEGVNDLATTHPHLLKEWDFTLNKIKPTEVTYGSGKKVGWVCSNEECGERWEVGINRRAGSNPTGCPYCNGTQKIRKGDSLGHKHPELSQEWDFDKNKELEITLEAVSPTSSRKVWWICENGYSWKAAINARVKGNQSCPCCNKFKKEKKPTYNQKTHEQFVQEVYELVGDEYKVIGTYTKGRERLEFLHKTCGEHCFISPDKFKQGARCQKCVNKNKGSYHKLTTEQFIERVKKSLGEDYEVLGEYVNYNTNIQMKHKVCGHIYEAKPQGILGNKNRKASGCPKCFGTPKRTQEEAEELVREVGLGQYELISEYKGSNSFVEIKHLECGRTFKAIFNRFKNEPKCRICEKENYVSPRQKTHEQFVQEVYELWGDQYEVLGSYIGIKEKIEIKHNACGHIHKHYPSNFLSGAQCPKCQKVVRKDTDYFNQELLEKFNGEYENKSEYKGHYGEIEVLHVPCGEVFKTKPSLILNSASCPYCYKGQNITQEVYERKIAIKHGDEYSVLGQYTGKDNFIKVRHNVCGKEYQTIAGNFLNGTQCPYCQNRQRKTTEEFKEELKELIGDEFTLMSEYKGRDYYIDLRHEVCGHIFDTKAAHFINTLTCPYCENRRVKVGFNDLETTHPLISSQWDYEKNKGATPKDVTASSNTHRYYWKCERGHKWKNKIANEIKRQGGKDGLNCKYCEGKEASHDFNLKTEYPHLVDEWHPTKNGSKKPTNYVPASGKKVWWKCELGHEWKTSIRHRTERKSNCPFCAGYYAWEGFNDLASQNPEVAKEWHPIKNGELKPNQVTQGSNKKVWWQCSKCQHEWQTTVGSRKSGTGCPKCNQSKGEEVVGKVLEGLELSHEAQYRFSDCRYKNTLPFDFAILNEAGEVHCLIEFDGEQHFYPVEAFGGEEGFKQTKKRDQIKNKYCQDNNILLIRIPYWLRDHVEEVLEYWLKEYQII